MLWFAVILNKFYATVYQLLFQINTILDGSKTWREYKDQRHDLFISDTAIAGYLTGKYVYMEVVEQIFSLVANN